MDEETTEDRLLGGRVRLLQPRRGHRAGTDAVLLAAACAARPGDRVADLGSASGAVGLMIAWRCPQSRLLFVERDAALAALCRRNLALNGMEERAEIVEADLFASKSERRRTGLLPDSCDIVATNPPFLQPGSDRRSPDPARAAAHHMPQEGLPAWIASAANLLKRGGRLVMIHRADRLRDCLDALTGFGAVATRPIYGRDGEAATRIIVSAVRGSRAPSLILPPLVLHDATGGFSQEAVALHDGGTWPTQDKEMGAEAPIS